MKYPSKLQNKENAQLNSVTESIEKGYRINESAFSPISNVYMNTVER